MDKQTNLVPERGVLKGRVPTQADIDALPEKYKSSPEVLTKTLLKMMYTNNELANMYYQQSGRKRKRSE